MLSIHLNDSTIHGCQQWSIEKHMWKYWTYHDFIKIVAQKQRRQKGTRDNACHKHHDIQHFRQSHIILCHLNAGSANATGTVVRHTWNGRSFVVFKTADTALQTSVPWFTRVAIVLQTHTPRTIFIVVRVPFSVVHNPHYMCLLFGQQTVRDHVLWRTSVQHFRGWSSCIWPFDSVDAILNCSSTT